MTKFNDPRFSSLDVAISELYAGITINYQGDSGAVYYTFARLADLLASANLADSMIVLGALELVKLETVVNIGREDDQRP